MFQLRGLLRIKNLYRYISGKTGDPWIKSFKCKPLMPVQILKLFSNILCKKGHSCFLKYSEC